MGLEQLSAIEAERARLGRPQRVQQHVCLGEQRLERGAAGAVGQVEAGAALAAVEVDELAAVQALAVAVVERAVPPQRVALRRLELDDRGPEVAQQLPGVGDRLALAELDDAQAVDGARHSRPPRADRARP